MELKSIRMTTILLAVLLSVSALQAHNYGRFRASANLGLVNGGTLGIRVDGDEKENRKSYVNLSYMTSDFTTYGGISYSERRQWNDRFYYVWTGGFDAGKIKQLYIASEPQEDDPEHAGLLMPHITIGVGYNYVRWKTGSAFIEWDVGLKLLLTNINVGIEF